MYKKPTVSVLMRSYDYFVMEIALIMKNVPYKYDIYKPRRRRRYKYAEYNVF